MRIRIKTGLTVFLIASICAFFTIDSLCAEIEKGKNYLTPETPTNAKVSIPAASNLSAADNKPAIKSAAVSSGISQIRALTSSGWTTIKSEDFEGAFPNSSWSAYAQSGYASSYWDDTSYKYHGGGWSAWCADSNISASGNYANNMRAWMIYGPFDLSDATSAKFTFYYWNDSESGYDYFNWFASHDGTNFNGYKVSGNSGGWVYKELDLASYCGDSSVWIAFLFTSDSSNIYKGAFVDDVYIKKYVSSVGNLGVTVKNQNGSNTSGALVKRYTSSWNLIDTKTTDSGGQVLWSDIDAGTYNLEAYYNGEFWVSDSATVVANSSTSKTLQRVEPYAYEFKVYNANTGADVTGGSVNIGTPLRYEVRVRNSRTFDRSVKVNLKVDRDQSSSYDFDSTSSSKTVSANGGTTTFTFNHTPSAAGTYYRSLEVQTYVVTDTKTDSWAWGSAVSVVDPNRAPSLASGYVTPSSGGTSAAFTYYVTYSDPDGDAPAVKTVNIDGSGGSCTKDMTYVSGSYTSGAVYKYSSTLALGSHSFYFYFTDGRGKDAMTSVINGPTVSNQPPVVNILAPCNNNTVSGMVNIQVQAYDPDIPLGAAPPGISKVEYYIDNVLKYTDYLVVNASPNSHWSWDTTQYTNGSHTIKARAYESGLAGLTGEQQISVMVRNAGNLGVTVRNQNSTTISGAQVYRYTSGGSLIDSKTTDSSGQMLWSNIDIGTYNLEAYSNGEFWVRDSVNVTANTSASKTLQRVEPYAYDFKVYNANTNQDVTGSGVTAGTPLRYEIKVRNSSTVDRTVKVRLLADRDQTSAYDFDSTSSSQTVGANGGTATITFSHTPTATGVYYRSLEVQTYVNNYTKTDSWAWGNAVTVLEEILDNGEYVTISHAPEPPVAGEAVTFSGKLNSPGSVANRTIYITSTEASLSNSVVTDSTGKFIYRWVPACPGTYYFCFGSRNGVCTFGDGFDVVTVFPARSKILSVDFNPASGLPVVKGSAFNLQVTVGLEATSEGVLQVWVTGSGISNRAWQYVPYSSSSLRQFNFTIPAPAKSGTFGYNVSVQFRPKILTGPLIFFDAFDSYSRKNFLINIAQDAVLYATVDIPQGYSAFSLPFDMTNKSISSVFGSNIPRYVYSWDIASSSYKIYPKLAGYNTFSSLELGKSYLIYSDSARQLSLTGKPVLPVTLNLTQGWNLVANSTGVDNLPIIALTVNSNGTSYSLSEAIAANLIKDGVYELKGQQWQLAKFLKLNKGYYVYASTPVQLVMNAVETPYLTSVGKDSFGGYVPAKGKMRFNLTSISETTQIKANISGADVSGVNLLLYDPSGVLRAAQQDSSTAKEVIINNPATGAWDLVLESTSTNDASVAGNIFIQHPASNQYSSLSGYKTADQMSGWMKCFYGVLGHGDELEGVQGLSCDIGANTMGVVPHPVTIVADELVDLVQIVGTCVAGPVVTYSITGDYGNLSGYANRCWPNLLAFAVPIAGDALQISGKVALKGLKEIGKNLDDIIKPITRIAAVSKDGSVVPDYLKVVSASGDKFNALRSGVKFSDEEIASLTTNQLKGEAAERLAKLFDEQHTTAKSLMKSDVLPVDRAAKLRELGLQKTYRYNGNVYSIGMGSYDPATWKANNVYAIKQSDGSVFAADIDRAFEHNGRLYLVQVKNMGQSQWSTELDIAKLKDLKYTFDTQFPKNQAVIVVQTLGDNPPLDILNQLKDAGIWVMLKE